MTRTRVAQVVSLACAHHFPCVISMRSCCVFDSLRLLHFPLFAVYLLSYRPVFPSGHQLHLPRCGGALQLMRTLALLPSTTLSHKNNNNHNNHNNNHHNHHKKMMEQLNSGELRTIFRNISRIVLIGLTTGGRKAWQEEEETRKDTITVLIGQEQSCTSELFKVIQDAVSLILLYKTL